MKFDTTLGRVMIALAIAAGLIPISLLIGLSAVKSLMLSAIIAVLFIGFSAAMSRILKG